MLFQVLDEKKECYAIFCDGELFKYPNSLELTHTWSHSAHAPLDDVEYASIWCAGKSLDEVCPEHLKNEWQLIKAKLKAFSKAVQTSKINLSDVCFYDFVSKQFLIDYCASKNKITEWVFAKYEKPKNYDLMESIVKFTTKIKNQHLNLDLKNLDFLDPEVRKTFNKIKYANSNIIYNPWGTVTGRLSTKPDSFPILTLNRQLRSVIKPNNDLFVEFDYNAAEVRVLLALLGEDQPEGDLHDWIVKNIFDDKCPREKAKTRVFRWLYNPKAQNKRLSERFDREAIIDKHYKDGYVYTPFGRKIKAPEEKALNYIIQSTTSDLFLTNMLKVDKMLSSRRSFISFCVHDSFLIDFAKEDQPMIHDMIEAFSGTTLGDFKVNVSMGKSFGTMRKVQ